MRPCPFASFYRSHPTAPGEYQSEDHGLTIYANRRLLPWQRRARMWPDENVALRDEQGVFDFSGGRWTLRNTSDEPMQVVGGATLPRGGQVEIVEGLQLLLSPSEDGLLAVFEFLKR